MAKRRKSGLDQALEVAAKLPWKVSLDLAPISSVGLFHLRLDRLYNLYYLLRK